MQRAHFWGMDCVPIRKGVVKAIFVQLILNLGGVQMESKHKSSSILYTQSFK